jgi:adenylate cyclase
LLGVGGWALWNFQRADPRAPETDHPAVPGFAGVPAIAVLPFDNLSGDPDQEYFVDGMTEDLITRLSSSQFLRVIARNSSFVYKGRAVDVKQVSRELDVRYVVEGSVRKSGDRVRISAQLIDATTGHHVWASTYDRELRDVFALQDEISQMIVKSIGPEVFASEQERMARRDPQSLDAYENVLRGWWHFFKFTRDDNLRARSFFERAAQLDPNYAMPFAGIASTHYADTSFGWTDSPTRSTAELEGAAERCVALDPRDAMCSQVTGFAHRAAGQLGEAIAAFERATQLNPSSSAAHYFLGSSLVFAGRPDKAIASIETAIRLSPHDPMMPFYLSGVGLAHFAAGRYDDAAEWAKRSVGPGSGPLPPSLLASSYAHLGRLDDARAVLEQLARDEPDYSVSDAELTLSSAAPSLAERFLDGLRKAGLKEE